MCGITGYVGHKNAGPILIEGLKRLEYRGYDSSGVGVIDLSTGHIIVRKTKGKIRNLEELIQQQNLPVSRIGISHTRWATHGAPNHVNSHPHADSAKKFLVVHNGIIENYEVLREELQHQGSVFVSETDTEVIPHLIASLYQGDFLDAVRQAIVRLQGSFAIGVLCADHPDTLIAARVGSPLIIGVGKEENFIASDVPAILDRTKRIIYLNDGEIARLTCDNVEIMKFSGAAVRPKIHTVKFSVDAVKKQGFAHFMLKEIHEQPEVLERILKSYLKQEEVNFPELNLSPGQLKGFERIGIIACGTAYHAGLVGKYAIEQLAGIPVFVDAASEFRYRDPILDEKTLLIAISQSGETADTLAAGREAQARGAKVIAVCNVVGSSLVRESHGVIYTHAGPEIGVASTKAYVAQVAVMFLLALKLSRNSGRTVPAQRESIIAQLRQAPAAYKKILAAKNQIAQIARKNSHFGCFLFLGRHINYPTALEGALKLKEISYIPAEGYAAGEMKHGPIALIDEYRAVVCVAPQSEIYEKMISNMQEIRARKGKIIAVATQGDAAIKKHSSHVIYIPATHNILTPLLTVLPLQMLAYFIAVQLGCDVDQPRNLAKSVTVE
ncbi:MAG: glutamine--fructose-6-phosphate transaminase (isomerizing) [Candidatus Omnitrophica bacterium]|nr:glutamine--fructose-6-phosphate transaminase (isomerizing) [Candidatus Omnitrophota bacterium]